jgi:hypothetical protein
MTGMRFMPNGYGGVRCDADRVKRDGWKEQGVLAVLIDDERLTWPEKELVRQSWGSAVWPATGATGDGRRLTGFPLDPGIRIGVHPVCRARAGIFWFLSRRLRIREGCSRHIASVRTVFWGSQPLGKRFLAPTFPIFV